MLPVIWVACGLAIVVTAVRSRRHPAALRGGRVAVAVLYLGAGAAVNAFFSSAVTTTPSSRTVRTSSS